MTGSDEPPVVYVSDRRTAKANAAAWLRHWGYSDVSIRPSGAVAGVDVAGGDVLAEVSAAAARVGLPALQRLVAAADGHPRLVFLSKAGYTAPALAYAEERLIALFTYDVHGRMTPLNAPAERVAARAAKASGGDAGEPGRSSWWARVTSHGLFVNVVGGTLAGLLVIAVAAALAWVWHVATSPSEVETAQASVAHLGVRMSIEQFRAKLGTPYVTRQVSAGPAGRWTDSLWLSDAYAVQTLSDSSASAAASGPVLLYSVTTRDASFAPPDPLFGVELGRGHFTDYGPLKLEPTVVASWRGPGADYFYSEAHELGPPGGDKTIVLTASAAGADQRLATSDFPDVLCGRPLCPAPRDTVQALSRLRKRLLVTTYTEIDGEKLSLDTVLDDLPRDFRFGPDWNTVSDFIRASTERE